MRYMLGLPLMVAAGSCIATGMPPGVVVGIVLAGLGFDVLLRG